MKRYILIFLILLSTTIAMAQKHVSDLVVTPSAGGTIKWYTASSGPNEITSPSTTDLIDGTTYYASQTVNGVESTTRLAVTATVNPQPQGSLTSNGTVCVDGSTGYLKWTATAGTGPYTVIYNHYGYGDHTTTNVTSGVAFAADDRAIWVEEGSQTYTLVSVQDANCTRTSGFTGGTATIFADKPTLTGASQVATVCAGNRATINLEGLLTGRTFTVDYSIDGVPQTPVTEVTSDNNSSASFTTTFLNGDNNGKTLRITGLTVTNPASGCSATFARDVTLSVSALPTPTFTAEAGATATTGTEVTYTTQSGKSGYVWTFPGTLTTDYTITSGGTSTDYTVTLKYVTTGSKTVTINYSANGCTAASAISSTATSVSTPLAIGTAYQGGRIAYFFQSGEPGYVEGETHGLIAALADLTGPWSTTVVQCYGSENALTNCWAASIYTNANAAASQTASVALGMGQANTTAIIARHDAGVVSKADYAAGICDDYTNANNGTGVYSDWYLPSRDELNKLRINQAVIGNFNGIADYWSSSEESAGGAFRMSFNTGDYLGVGKGNSIRFRPVRNF